jgi:hypothetical protein
MSDRLLTAMIKEQNDGALNLFWNVALPVGVSVPQLRLDKAAKNAHVLEVSLQLRSPYIHFTVTAILDTSTLRHLY